MISLFKFRPGKSMLFVGACLLLANAASFAALDSPSSGWDVYGDVPWFRSRGIPVVAIAGMLGGVAGLLLVISGATWLSITRFATAKDRRSGGTP